MSSSRRSVGQIFLVPAVVAVATGSGLEGALAGEGIWDLLGSIFVAVPATIFLACILRHWRVRRG